MGGLNTGLYFVTFNLLRLTLSAYPANSLAVAISIVFSFWANRRFTFKGTGSHRKWRQFGEFSLVFLATLLVSNLALSILFSVENDVSVFEENVALIASSGILVLVRFWFMRKWVFDPER